MFILTINGREDEGAYSVVNEDGNQVLYLFEEEDDATRFALMLEEDDYPEMHVMEIESDLLVNVCEMQGHEYVIITPNDIVIPPKENDII
jgi:hypothetical protein